jgi:serine/threonine protein kinase
MNDLLHKGLRIGEYLLESFIGSGAQAEVWLVRELKGGKRSLACKLFACKFEDRSLRENQISRSALEREADILGDLDHSYIAKYHYVIEDASENKDGDNLYVYGLVFDFAPIGTLAQTIQKPSNEYLDVEGRLLIVRCLAEAVDHIHDVKIVHSDLKPENILLRIENRRLIPIIMDFGGAFRINEQPPGMVTPEYAAPEIRSFGSSPSFKSDVFALGLIFHEILTQRKLPFINEGHKDNDPIDEGVFPQSLRAHAGYLKRMIRYDVERRDSISQTKDSIERHQQAHYVRSATGAPRHSTFPTRRYLWNAHVHERFKCSKKFVFLKGLRPTAEARWLDSNLIKEDLPGASVRRLFGAFDFLIEGWFDADAEERLKTVYDKFQSEHHNIRIKPIYWNAKLLHSNSRLRNLSNISSTIILDQIHTAVSKPDAEAAKLLQSQHLIESFWLPPKGVRFFLEINWSDEMPDEALAHYGRVIFEYLNEKIVKPYRKWIRVYQVSRTRIFATLITREFGEYKDILLGVSRVLRKRTINDVLSFTTATHIDLDGLGFIESDDGLLPNFLQLEYG